jgi:hypothetical protein
MKHYLSYHDKAFLKSFANTLNIERLIDTSVDLSPNQVSEKYTKECCLDFSGISAILLYESGFKYLKHILDNIELFYREKIRIHLRFLLVYPYSAHAIARIQAETSQNRATIKEPKFKKSAIDIVGRIDGVDMNLFNESDFVKSQKEFLRYISLVMSEYNIFSSSDNRIVIRFTPTAVNVCMYRINDVMYISPYLLAKDSREVNKCVDRSPVIEIIRSADRGTFDAFIDHFRYLWGLPQAIYLEDATEYTPLNPRGIKNIKPPMSIDFVSKSRRIIAKKEHSDAVSWRRQAKDLLVSLCPIIPKAVLTRETIFIACSWSKKDGIASYAPNFLAKKMKAWLLDDLSKCFDVQIVNVMPGVDVDDKIYDSLNRSTVGIILLTADIMGNDGEYYSKPNIYHELGYLMAKYGGCGGDSNVIIIAQSVGVRRVVIPSNVNNKGYVDLRDDAIYEVYHKVFWYICEKLFLDAENICQAINMHKRRIKGISKKSAASLDSIQITCALRA